MAPSNHANTFESSTEAGERTGSGSWDEGSGTEWVDIGVSESDSVQEAAGDGNRALAEQTAKSDEEEMKKAGRRAQEAYLQQNPVPGVCDMSRPQKIGLAVKTAAGAAAGGIVGAIGGGVIGSGPLITALTAGGGATIGGTAMLVVSIFDVLRRNNDC